MNLQHRVAGTGLFYKGEREDVMTPIMPQGIEYLTTCTTVFDLQWYGYGFGELLIWRKQPMADRFPGRAVQIKQFVKESPTIPWLVKDLLPDVGWTLLVGRKGIGKTTFAMQMCLALQTGDDFLDRVTQQRDILFVQVDSVELEWRAILARIAKDSLGWTLVSSPTNCLDNPSYVSSLAGLIAKVNPGYIVWDSLYKLSRRPVNTERVTDTLDQLALLSGTVPWLLIHHPPHEETRAAGHHSIGATCSNEWHLLKNKLAIDKGRLVKDKEVLLDKDEQGLWQVKHDAESDHGTMMSFL